jgi:CDP-diacylglycerol---serine O-phosphatidyltransferase
MTSYVEPGRPRKRRHVADLLSFTNFLFGVSAIALALDGRYVFSLLCVALGALCDGLDGAAARRWGGTRLGVLADDLADGVTYGVAPAVALGTFLGGAEGLAMALGYTAFTLTRLVHFTLDKGNADPRYFRGVPSTLGGITVLCAVIACEQHPLLVALVVGAVSVKMVTFSARYRHLGRWFAELTPVGRIAPALAVVALGVGVIVNPVVTATVLLLAAAPYLLWPTVKDLRASVVRALG